MKLYGSEYPMVHCNYLKFVLDPQRRSDDVDWLLHVFLFAVIWQAVAYMKIFSSKCAAILWLILIYLVSADPPFSSATEISTLTHFA